MGSRSVPVVTSPLSSSNLFLFVLFSSVLPSMRPALGQDLSATETAVEGSDVPSTSWPPYAATAEFEPPANQTAATPPGGSGGVAETPMRNTPPPPAETGLSTANSGVDGDDEDTPPAGGTRCQGYYDVMGQWDPPFNCNAGVFLYCCGTCFYRFCCQFPKQRLDQNICSNYDTPIWANTGKPVAAVTEGQADADRDRTHLVVYIICGVVAVMVLAGIFAKLGLEKSRGGGGVGGGVGTDLTNARTLTDLLKQPGGEMTSVDVMLANSPTGGRANGISARMLRSRSEQYHLNNGGYGPFGQGLARTHSNHSSLGLNKYTSLKAVADTASRSYYKSFPLMDFSHYQAAPPPIPAFHHSSSLHQHHHFKDKSYLHQSPLGPHHLADLHAPLSISIPPNPMEHQRLPKTTTLPVIPGSAFKAWETSGRHVQRQTSAPGRSASLGGGYHHHHAARRHAYSTRRQHSIENMPDLFGQQYMRAYGAGDVGGGVLGQFQGHGHHVPHPSSYYHHARHKSFSTHSKTEVTV